MCACMYVCIYLFVCYWIQAFLLMVVTLSGPTGLDVAGHAQKGLSSAFVRAPILRLQTAEQTVGDWDQL